MKRTLLILSLACLPRVAFATGQCDPSPIEQLSNRPDDLPAYATGKLGVVQRSFPRMFLAPAYLILNGGALDKLEQKAVIELWARRILMGTSDWRSTEAWKAARATVAGVRKLGTDEPPFGGTCLADAFSDAATTLARLSAAGGLSAAERKDWVGAQDTVFGNCANTKVQIPPEAASTASPLARNERRYQIASAYLYSRDFAKATKAFAALASDKDSPWAPWSAYFVARTKLRFALSGKDTDQDALPAVRALFARIASGTGPVEVRRAALSLQSYVDAVTDGKAHLKRVMPLVRKGGMDYADALGDWVIALDRMLGEESAADVAMPDAVPDDLAPLRAHDDLVDWVLTFSHDAPERYDGEVEASAEVRAHTRPAYAHAYARWRATHSVAWLIAALANVKTGDNHLDEVLAAAVKVPETSPARDSVDYYLLPFLQLKPAAMRAWLEREIAARAARRRSSFLNLLYDRRLGLVTSPDDAMRWSTRAVLGDDCGPTAEELSLPEGGPEHAKLTEIAPALESAIEHSVPLSGLSRFQSEGVPRLLARRSLAMSWARALVLGAHDANAAKQADALLPALRRDRADDRDVTAALDALAAATGDDRPLQAALALLALTNQVDPGRLSGELSCPGAEDNAPSPDEDDSDHHDVDAKITNAVERVFAKADRAARRAEIATMKPLGSQFDIAVAWIMAWANAHPSDARLPRIFYDVNQRSRRLHGACHASRSSKAAFQLMHKLFPADPLTKKTRYWY